MDPKKPQQFWNVFNNNRKNEVKPTIQPIKKQDGTYAICDLEIIEEMKSQYGKESLNVKNTNPEWYNEVENFVKSTIENTKKNLKNTMINEDFENQDISLEEVTRAIDRTNLPSAPSPEEKVFSILIKKGGDNMAAALLHLFQTCWSSGTLCESFKLDPKILMPKVGKDNYNSVRSYRPITLESVIGKFFQRTVADRLLEIKNIQWLCLYSRCLQETTLVYSVYDQSC